MEEYRQSFVRRIPRRLPRRRSQGFYGLHALHKRPAGVDLSASLVKIFRSDTNDKMIAQVSGALEQIDVALVQHIIGAVGNDFGRGLLRFALLAFNLEV